MVVRVSMAVAFRGMATERDRPGGREQVRGTPANRFRSPGGMGQAATTEELIARAAAVTELFIPRLYPAAGPAAE
ncbi:hypothetical protein Lfu02_12450 [Longispora fulva]|nr:hypothetical protein Lfu02_12450 [Longispora fulva]